MTSARAYRPARGTPEALRELWRCAGSQFDAEVVQALARALPAIEAPSQSEARNLASLTAPRLTMVGAGGRV
jgi:HD-GYP domain-containing protein (c-di-GMP phosphodiesterase class II)